MKMQEESFIVEGFGGERKLTGKIKVNGSKNGALPFLSSVFLFNGPVTFKNVPNIEDVKRMLELLKDLGVKIKKEKYSITLDATDSRKSDLTREISKRFRASIMLLGPILGKMGKVQFPHPGGCVIGARPIDLFIDNFKKMGCHFEETDGTYSIETSKDGLLGTNIVFKVQSVGASETFIMASVLAKGKTVLKNIALEPEVVELAKFLKSCGAKIEGIGTTTLEIEGGEMLKNPTDSINIMPDRLETGSFMILGALCGKNLIIENCNPSHLDVPIKILDEMGIDMDIKESSITIKGLKKGLENTNSTNIKTHEYPGFPTDIQAPMVVLLSQSKGESLVFETIFEGRLSYTDELKMMGADIKMYDAHNAVVKGPTSLKAKELKSPDIRAGLAFIMAAIIANGKSVIGNAYLIDRGYEKIENRLRKLGVNIKRVKN